MKLSSNYWLIAGMLVLVNCASMLAQDAPHAVQVDALIEQLGADNFAARESASMKILSYGELALPSLRAVSEKASFEVRHRISVIQQQIEDDKFNSLAKSFLLDSVAENSYGLPGWRKYREIAGATRTSKLLFLDMIREQPEIAHLIELSSSSTATRQHLQSLEALASNEASNLRERMYTLEEPQLGDAVAMLLTAAALPTTTPIEVSDILVQIERRKFAGNVDKQGYGNCLRKLIGAWLPKTHDALGPNAMFIALEHDLSQGAAIARRHVNKNFGTDTRKLAFYCLARFGNETDIASLIPMLDDSEIVDEFPRETADSEFNDRNTAPPGSTDKPFASNNMVVRISDFALATVLLLSNQPAQEYFPDFKSHARTGFNFRSLASPADAAAEQRLRIEKWKKNYASKQVES